MGISDQLELREQLSKQKKIVQDNVSKIQENYSQKHNEWLRLLISLAAGALVLSISLREQLLSGNTSFVWALKLSWTLLTSSIFCGLWALWGEPQTQKEAAEQLYQKGKCVIDAWKNLQISERAEEESRRHAEEISAKLQKIETLSQAMGDHDNKITDLHQCKDNLSKAITEFDKFRKSIFQPRTIFNCMSHDAIFLFLGAVVFLYLFAMKN